MTTAKTSLMADTPTATPEDIKCRYCIDQDKLGSCGEPVNYNVYKGTLEDKHEVVLNCVEKRDCIAVTLAMPQTLEFFSQGQYLAKLNYISKNGCCGEAIHRIVVPDVVGDRRVAEIKSKAACGKQGLELEATPYFKSTTGFHSYVRCAAIALIPLGLVFEMLGYMFLDNITIMFIFFAIAIGIIWGALIWLFCWRFRFSCTRSQRVRLLELVNLAGTKKVADVYLVKSASLTMHR